MPHFTRQIIQTGPILDVHIGVSRARRDILVETGQPVPRAVRIQGLVDTGASGTCIDGTIPRTLGLPPRTQGGTILTPSTGSTPVPVNLYDVSLIIPPGQRGETPHIVPNLLVSTQDIASQEQGYQALIGRDVLARCLLVYNGALGRYTLAF